METDLLPKLKVRIATCSLRRRAAGNVPYFFGYYNESTLLEGVLQTFRKARQNIIFRLLRTINPRVSRTIVRLLTLMIQLCSQQGYEW
jgi:hypothetical protein